MLDDPFTSRKKRPDQQRPTLWAEGSQKPTFDLRAFARASLHLTRDGIAPVLASAATATAGFATTVASGKYRVPTDRWGRTGRFLPSYGRVAGWIDGTAGILARAGETAIPAAPGTAPPPAPKMPKAPVPTGAATIIPTRPRSKRSAGETPPEPVEIAPEALPDIPPVAPIPEDDPLLAIRAVLGPDAAPGTTTPENLTPTAPSRLSQGLIHLTGTALGWGLTALALPYGAVRATLAHLNGEDLRSFGKEP